MGTHLHDSWSPCNLLEAAAVPLSVRTRRSALVVIALILTGCFLGAVWQVNQHQLRSRQVAASVESVMRLLQPMASKKPLNETAVWEEREAIKAAMPRTTYFEGWTVDTLQQELPIWVISLARAKERRAAVINGLKAAGVRNYELIDAVDYRQNTTIEVHKLLKKYANPWKRHLWYKRQKHYSSKIAIDMSHFRLLERVAASNRCTLILEDDAQLTGEKWLPDLLTTLQELPEDWDILYLNAAFTTRGRAVSPHLVVVRKTPVTIGYVATPGFAQQLLDAAKDPKHGSWVDILIEYTTAAHDIQAYIAEPPLVNFLGAPSTVDGGTEDIASWEHKWSEALRG